MSNLRIFTNLILYNTKDQIVYNSNYLIEVDVDCKLNKFLEIHNRIFIQSMKKYLDYDNYPIDQYNVKINNNNILSTNITLQNNDKLEIVPIVKSNFLLDSIENTGYYCTIM